MQTAEVVVLANSQQAKLHTVYHKSGAQIMLTPLKHM